MQRVDPEVLKGGSIYFTEADPVIVSQEPISLDHLEYKLKAWLLLVDNVVISAAI